MTKLRNGIEIPDPIIFSAHIYPEDREKMAFVFVSRVTCGLYTITHVPSFRHIENPRFQAWDNHTWTSMVRLLKSYNINDEPSTIHREYDMALTTVRTTYEPAHGLSKCAILSEKRGDETIISLSANKLTGETTEHLYRKVETLEGIHWDHTRTISFIDGHQAAKHYFDAGWELMEKTVTDTWRKLEEI